MGVCLEVGVAPLGEAEGEVAAVLGVHAGDVLRQPDVHQPGVAAQHEELTLRRSMSMRCSSLSGINRARYHGSLSIPFIGYHMITTQQRACKS